MFVIYVFAGRLDCFKPVGVRERREDADADVAQLKAQGAECPCVIEQTFDDLSDGIVAARLGPLAKAIEPLLNAAAWRTLPGDLGPNT